MFTLFILYCIVHAQTTYDQAVDDLEQERFLSQLRR